MVNLLPTIRLAQSILKRKFPSVDKPLRIKDPPKISHSKRAFEKYKPRAYFWNFTVSGQASKSENHKLITVNCYLRFVYLPLIGFSFTT